jgi:acetyl-CoA carboxylase carboxyltransferase component
MSDITVMLKGAVMAVSSPKVTSLATGEDAPPEELGGWKLHEELTGLADAAGETEEECIHMAKMYLSYLPSHAEDPAPRVEALQSSTGKPAHILDILPEKANRAYDMRNIVKTIVDGGQFLELKAHFGRPCITAFARLDGHAIGIVANNPLYGAGALDADCCEKITSFLVLCDSFNIPIVTLVDTPGFLVGKEGEKRKITGKIINWMNALSLVTVPKLTVVVRKIYGQAYLNMGGGKYSDVFVAWPTAEISFMGLEPAVNVVFGVKKEKDPERFEELLSRMAKDTEPWGAAGLFGLNEIIDPADTRQFLIRMLELLRNRKRGGMGRRLLSNWPTSY